MATTQKSPQKLVTHIFSNFNVVKAQSIADLNTPEIQAAKQASQEVEDLHKLHISFDQAFMKAKMRSKIITDVYGNHRLCGMFLSIIQFYRLSLSGKEAISRLRKFFMEELITETGKTEIELSQLLNVNIYKKENLVIWQRSSKWEQNPNYQLLVVQVKQQSQQAASLKAYQKYKKKQAMKTERKENWK